MKCFILTEGSKKIGFGHITRCSALYQAFEEYGITPEFIVNGDNTVKRLLYGKKHRILNWVKKEKVLFKIIKDSAIVIIDSYLAGNNLYKKISNFVKLPVYIDDNIRLNYPRGIVINGTINSEKFKYLKKNGVIYLLGSKYMPLRKEFWNVPKKIIRKNIENVMITFGGEDHANLTPRILKVFTEDYPEIKKIVIIGGGFRNIDKIEKHKDNRIELMYSPDATGMKEAMRKSDVAISAGGQTLYELARVGVPTIAVAVADNQINNVKGWQTTGFIEYAGWFEDEDILKKISLCFKKTECFNVRIVRNEISNKYIDGYGTLKTVKYCICEYYKHNIRVRESKLKDMYAVLNISNEIDIRRNSFNSKKIRLNEHKSWYSNKLNDKNCVFLVAEIDNNIIGQIRFEVNEDEAVISISIAKDFRGFGIGAVIIKKALSILKANKKNVVCVKAYVKKNNINSRKFFENNDFRYFRETKIKGHIAIEYMDKQKLTE